MVIVQWNDLLRLRERQTWIVLFIKTRVTWEVRADLDKCDLRINVSCGLGHISTYNVVFLIMLWPEVTIFPRSLNDVSKYGGMIALCCTSSCFHHIVYISPNNCIFESWIFKICLLFENFRVSVFPSIKALSLLSTDSTVSRCLVCKEHLHPNQTARRTIHRLKVSHRSDGLVFCNRL